MHSVRTWFYRPDLMDLVVPMANLTHVQSKKSIWSLLLFQLNKRSFFRNELLFLLTIVKWSQKFMTYFTNYFFQKFANFWNSNTVKICEFFFIPRHTIIKSSTKLYIEIGYTRTMDLMWPSTNKKNNSSFSTPKR